jgi:hypothetical protein
MIRGGLQLKRALVRRKGIRRASRKRGKEGDRVKIKNGEEDDGEREGEKKEEEKEDKARGE